MKRYILGVDTSNYKTSCAAFCIDDGSVQNLGRFLKVEHGALGLRQSEALFQHVKALPQLMEDLCIDGKIAAVGYSSAPRSVEGSYMPCFLAGESVARSVASVSNAQCYAFSHQQGHLMSALYSANAMHLAKVPFLAWHLSGGTTELLLIHPEGDGIFAVEILGGTADISAGQVIDRCGVALGFDFPAGIYVEQLALKSSCTEKYKVKHSGFGFSLSGMENQFNKSIEAGVCPQDVCAMVLSGITALVQEVTCEALSKYKLPIVFSGGVANCKVLQKAFDTENIFFAQNGLGGDNALGTALLAAVKEGALCL